MAGAIIPDDWDGVTFECNKIQWPASLQWQAILLGQMTELTWPSYWDADSGDVEDAQQAANDAFDLTIPDIYSEDCNVIPGIPVPAFYVIKSSSQAIPAATWTTVTWETIDYGFNNPNFSLALNSHVPVNANLIGLWHYDVFIRFSIATLLRVRARQQPGSVDKSWGASAADIGVGTSFDVPHEVGGNQLRVEVWSQVANTITQLVPFTRYMGHFLGPVSE